MTKDFGTNNIFVSKETVRVKKLYCKLFKL